MMNTLSWQPRFTKVTLIDHFFQLSCRTWFAEKKEKVSLKECVVFLRDLRITGTKVIFQQSMHSCSPDPCYAGYECGQ